MQIEPDASVTSQQGSASVSYLDQALWQQLSGTNDLAGFSAAWLALQCAMISGSRYGVVIHKKEDRFLPIASWPDDAARSIELETAAQHALQERKGIVNRQDDTPESDVCIAYPILVDGNVFGVVAIETSFKTDIQVRSIMRQVQWGTAWFEAFHRREMPHQISVQNERLAVVVKLMASCLDSAGLMPAISSMTTELATQLGCERVSLGFAERGKRMRVQAISHSANFDKKSNLVQQIGKAMDEAWDQLNTIVYPPDPRDKYLVCQVHEKLASMGNTKSVATFLITGDDGKIFGALTLEHPNPEYFTDDVVALCKQITLLIGPIVELKRRDDRMLLQQMGDACKRFGAKLVGEEHLVAKSIAVVVALLIGYMSLVDGEFRVSAQATVEGSVQRHISAPIDGYISAQYARAGDIVHKGDPLFSLDDRDLQLEKLKMSSQKLQVEQKYRDALQRHDQTEASIQKAQLDQVVAQIDLIDSQLTRIKAVAPFDGVVVAGDLSQELGAPVREGDTLLKVAPLDSYRIVLDVNELDITDIKVGDKGRVSLSALPDATLPFVVSKITPESSISQGKNTFKVEAQLEQQPKSLRPGMEGTGKIYIAQRSLIWIWTHRFFNWLQVWYWSWAP